MPKATREQWIGACRENFDDAIDANDMSMAKCAVIDMLDAGYVEESLELHQKLVEFRKGRLLKEDMRQTLHFLKMKQHYYEQEGTIPTIGLLISDMEYELNMAT